MPTSLVRPRPRGLHHNPTSAPDPRGVHRKSWVTVGRLGRQLVGQRYSHLMISPLRPPQRRRQRPQLATGAAEVHTRRVAARAGCTAGRG
eukprot:scaffold70466_cov76-Phaeocystis_antarctica.AAC.1